MRICKNCKVEKSLDDFNNHPRMTGGKFTVCKDCKNKRNREYHVNYYAENKDRINKAAREKKPLIVYNDTPRAKWLRSYYKLKKEQILSN